MLQPLPQSSALVSPPAAPLAPAATRAPLAAAHAPLAGQAPRTFLSPLLQGKRGLVLGLADEHSIAYGFARHARAQGAELALTCLNARAFEAVEPLARSLDSPLIVCNVEDEQALAAAVERTVALLGGLDFVLHSIAWAPLADLHGRVADSSIEGFERALEISCHSFARVARLCEPHMAGNGSLVTVSYLGAARAVPHYGLMGPAKAALEATVRYLALEMGPGNIRVHAVSAGPIRTRAASGIEDFDALLEDATRHSALRRCVTLPEIASLAAFLCSDAAAGMTGQTVFVDGGRHAVL